MSTSPRFWHTSRKLIAPGTSPLGIVPSAINCSLTAGGIAAKSTIHVEITKSNLNLSCMGLIKPYITSMQINPLGFTCCSI